MNYTIETAIGTWRIEEDPKKNWVLLKLRRTGSEKWSAINIYYTAAGAAAAVGCGETTEPAWDDAPHDPHEFLLSRWIPETETEKRVSAA